MRVCANKKQPRSTKKIGHEQAYKFQQQQQQQE